MPEHDLPRFAQRYGVQLNFNPHFPINTLGLVRGAIAAQRLQCFDEYVDPVFEAVWVQQLLSAARSVPQPCLWMGRCISGRTGSTLSRQH